MKAVLAVDLGGTNMAFGLMQRHGRLLARSKIPTQIQDGPKQTLARMAQALSALRQQAKGVQIKAIGMGCPGPLNAKTGVVIATPNLVGWKNIPVTRIISQVLKLPAFLDNDARCAALGEWVYGAGQGKYDLLTLTLGTGVGGGVIIGGQPLSGVDSTAGELGHYAIDPHGPVCNCGQRGCLEAYASATALAYRSRVAVAKVKRGPLWRLCGGDLSKVTARLAHQALRQGDPAVKAVWQEAGWALGVSVAGLINVFNPQVVALAGGVMNGGQELLNDTRRIAKKLAYPTPARRVRIVRSSLNDEAGVLGAGEMAFRRLGL